jgi:hypothetical protein
MIDVRRFTETGTEAFRAWLSAGATGGNPDQIALNQSFAQSYTDRQIDPAKSFGSRYELGKYLCAVFDGISVAELLAQQADGLWAWICAIYFRQLAVKGVRRAEHYVPIRRGSAGSLLHRNAARTAFELVAIHGENAIFALQQKVHTHGQLLESLSASQSIVRNHGFFAAAAKMYVGSDGKIRKGATSKPKKPKDRKAGDSTGKGSIRRLPLALRRLDLTYDVDALTADGLIALLPKEYSKWTGDVTVKRANPPTLIAATT